MTTHACGSTGALFALGGAPAARAALIAAACALLGACATPTSRLLPDPKPAPTLDWAATAPDGTRIAVREVIVRNSPGSWVRDASWDEYLIAIENPSAAPLAIERIELDSSFAAAAGPLARESTTSRAALERDSSATLKFAKDAGLIVGSGLAPIGAAVAIVSAGGGVFAAGAGTAMAAAGAVFVVAPVAITVAVVHVVKRHRIEREDATRIDQRLLDRGLTAPAELAASASLEKSAFFPITPAPTRIGVHYRLAGEARELWLPLPALAELHLARATAPSRPKPSRPAAVQ